MAITQINTAKLLASAIPTVATGVLLNQGQPDETILSNGSTGFLRDLYDEWLAEPNTPEPVETLPEAKDRRKAELSIDAENAINGGFVSSALGPANTYASTEDAIRLLLLVTTASVADSLPRQFDASGTPAVHTNLQLLALNVDAEAHIAAQIANLAAKQAAVDAVPDTGDLGVDIPNVDAVTF